ncbi:MAG: SoxR reducing system RseC family protein [Candidatus Acetothermia bacterium]
MSEDVEIREGVVTERDRNGVKVKVFENLDCDDCEGTCGGSDNSFPVSANDPIGVVKGDWVEVVIKPRSFGKVSFLVFGVPAIALMSGLGIGTLVSDIFFGGTYDTPLQGGISGFLFLLSLIWLVSYDRTLASREDRRAEIKRRLENNCRGDIDLDTGSY